jgi:hypothetical protein
MSTEFDTHIRQSLRAIIDYEDTELAIDEVVESIKQAVDKYVIGKPLDALDVGALTGPNDKYSANEAFSSVQAATLMAHNGLVARQRQSLWGKK